MTTPAVRQFEKTYEVLAGKVHLAEDTAAAAEVVRSILEETGASRVALGELPQELVRAIEQFGSERGVQVLKPPFAGASLPDAIDAAQVGITAASFAIGDAGALVEVTTDDAVRLVSTLPRTHIGLVRAADLVETLDEAAPRLREIFRQQDRNCAVTFISGPSRTADIEMQLTLGVHGPEAAHAIVLLETNDSQNP
jgi:L-lactate dehydrogenase complex protein LldG